MPKMYARRPFFNLSDAYLVKPHFRNLLHQLPSLFSALQKVPFYIHPAANREFLCFFILHHLPLFHTRVSQTAFTLLRSPGGSLHPLLHT